jgi:hypothetical protein
VIIEVITLPPPMSTPHLGGDGAFLDLDDLALEHVAR